VTLIASRSVTTAKQRGMPRYWRAPIMTGDYRLRHPESVEQSDHVADEVRSVYCARITNLLRR
jgi:hypothetical protein